MKCIKNDVVTIRRFIFDADEPNKIDPITLLLNENNRTLTVTNHFGIAYTFTWHGFSSEYTFLEFFAGKHFDLDYTRRKLGIKPTNLSLSKSKKAALEYFFKNVRSDVSKEEKGEAASRISAIYTEDPEEFNDQAYSIISEYTSCYIEGDFAVCDYTPLQKYFLEALVEMSKELGKEFNC